MEKSEFMLLSCKRCSNRKFQVPFFTMEQKKILTDLKANNKFLDVIIKIKEWYAVELIDAKFILEHINETYGKCNRCKIDYLDKEYMICPKCKALNFNWEISDSKTI